MTFGSKHLETAKLGPQRITVKSFKAGQPHVLVESSIVFKLSVAFQLSH